MRSRTPSFLATLTPCSIATLKAKPIAPLKTWQPDFLPKHAPWLLDASITHVPSSRLQLGTKRPIHQVSKAACCIGHRSESNGSSVGWTLPTTLTLLSSILLSRRADCKDGLSLIGLASACRPPASRQAEACPTFHGLCGSAALRVGITHAQHPSLFRHQWSRLE